MQKLLHRWKQYKYRFVPWLILNLKNRSLRSVTDKETDCVISDEDFQAFITNFLAKLHQLSDEKLQMASQQDQHNEGLRLLRNLAGFTVERAPSVLTSGGTGVKVTSGVIPKFCVTSLYPGLIYEPQDPILFQSIGNPFIFRCADGILLDGNDRALSRFLFKSCRGRDSCWPLSACDDSWLTPYPRCPLNVGQYVNNQSKQYPANVAYQEFNLPIDFPARLRQYLPNNHYTPSFIAEEGLARQLRVVALVSLREIHCGEELFSSYFTVVR
ncbi:unnamed protein product [Candidula unifasciata]|uniref:SET domain-containing protein n=1 Tax=Candidula unifasciata TaxID=100452 RepID=A0A8S4A3E6_9EUPU|nr:unnamed protein product [Candidula unifasciata]